MDLALVDFDYKIYATTGEYRFAVREGGSLNFTSD